MPAVTDAVPTSDAEVAATAAADGWSAGDPPAQAPVTAVSFNVEQSDADAIGEMIINDERPLLGFN